MTMTVDPDTSSNVQTSPSNDARPASRNAGQGLTREQFEAAMRVMDARSPSRPVSPSTAPPDSLSPASV